MKPGTIFALSTASGKSGIAVIRVSGDFALQSIKKLGVNIPTPRKVQKARLKDPTTMDVIDDAIVVYFQAPHSFTGEDVVEYQIHGSRAVVENMLGVLRKLPDYRIADPGEFTRRAFENRKMDLTEAEGLADLINAETIMQSKQALRQMDGAIGNVLSKIKERIISILSLLEATIDFSDEEIPDDLVVRVEEEVSDLITILQQHLCEYSRAERIRDGIQVAILGEPNVGKSSLLNVLVKRDAAIVSKVAGTTRDIIEVFTSIGGYPVIFFDTAGIRDNKSEIEGEGIRRALSKANQADLKIVVFNSTKPYKKHKKIDALTSDNAILVWNKSDLLTEKQKRALKKQEGTLLSTKTEAGLEKLLKSLQTEIEERFKASDNGVLTRLRHKEAVEKSVFHLQSIWDKSGKLIEIEFAAEELRMASRELGRVTGVIEVEALLDKIFSDFCIGK